MRIIITIEQRRSVAGKPRFGYVTPGVLHPGRPSRSIRTWETRRAAREAARREYPGAMVMR